MRTYACREAVEFLTEALSLSERLPTKPSALQRGRWERRLGVAYMGLGQMEKSKNYLESAAATLGWPVPRGLGPQIVTILRELLAQIGRRFQKHALVAGDAPLTEAAETTLEAARAYEPLLEIYFILNDQALSLHTSLVTLNLSEATGRLSPELAKAYAALCVACSAIPAYPLSRMYRHHSLGVARQINDQPALAYSLRNIGIFHSGAGDWPNAHAVIEEAVEIFRRLGDRHMYATCLSVLSRVFFFQSNFDQAARLFSEVYQLGVDHDDPQVQGWGLSGQADSILPLGQLAESSALAERAAQFASDRTVETSVYGSLAISRLRQYQWDAARQTADRTAALLAQSPPVLFITLDAYAGVAEVYLTLWAQQRNQPEARVLQARARAALGALGSYARVFPIGRPRIALFRGRYAWQTGNTHAATHEWQRSLAAASRLQMDYDQALAHVELALHGVAVDHSYHEQRGRAILERLGASYDLARIQTDTLADKGVFVQ